jgi:DICT domain-containing protein
VHADGGTTEQLGRDLRRPVRVLAARDLAKARVQARVQRNPFYRDGRMRFNAIAERSPTAVVWLRPHNAN